MGDNGQSLPLPPADLVRGPRFDVVSREYKHSIFTSTLFPPSIKLPICWFHHLICVRRSDVWLLAEVLSCVGQDVSE